MISRHAGPGLPPELVDRSDEVQRNHDEVERALFGDEYEALPSINPAVVAQDQVVGALLDLDRHADRFLRWPYHELDTLTGPLGAGGEVWFVCAYSGGGKTTFVASTIELWRRLGKRVYVMPLETRPKTFRTYLACMAQGVHPGDALSGHLQRMSNGEAVRQALRGELMAQLHTPYVDQVMISEQPAINVDGLQKGLKEAKSFGADVVIVDHIDHIESGDSKGTYGESKRVNHAALHMAQDNGLLLLFTSQLNLEADRGTDHLTKYMPPRDRHVLMGGAKRQVATGMVGLFRRLRSPGIGEDSAAYARAVKKAREGEIPAPEILDRGVMGVNAMKLRHYGAREGGRVFLPFARGKVG